MGFVYPPFDFLFINKLSYILVHKLSLCTIEKNSIDKDFLTTLSHLVSCDQRKIHLNKCMYLKGSVPAFVTTTLIHIGKLKIVIKE